MSFGRSVEEFTFDNYSYVLQSMGDAAAEMTGPLPGVTSGQKGPKGALLSSSRAAF